jgi:hypothetical protein
MYDEESRTNIAADRVLVTLSESIGVESVKRQRTTDNNIPSETLTLTTIRTTPDREIDSGRGAREEGGQGSKEDVEQSQTKVRSDLTHALCVERNQSWGTSEQLANGPMSHNPDGLQFDAISLILC